VISVHFDSIQFKKVLKDSVAYSIGFLDGVEMKRIEFNVQMAEFIKDSLGKFIDAKARVSPDELHHVYEWGQNGTELGRLFYFDAYPTKNSIKFRGGFHMSQVPSPTADRPFFDKARVMENGIAVTIVPVHSDVLVFEVDGETVFTPNSVYVAHPGGDAVAGSFGRAVEEYFNSYLTGAVLAGSGLFQHLERANEFTDYFAQGAHGGGRASGIFAGQKYLSLNPTLGGF
jgi:hypothetical protein